MPYLNRFDYDVFLSHGWSNNEDESRGDRNWVAELRDELQTELRDRLQGFVSVFLDVETARNGDTESLFHNYVRRSAIFLAIVSPGFCSQESFCRKELTWFCKNARPISSHPLETTRRLFKIVSRPVVLNEQPEQIRQHSPYTFYDGDPGPDLLGYNLLPVNTIRHDITSMISREYRRLVPALASFLDRCRQDQSSFPLRTVFLGESSAPEREELQREISMHEIVSCSPSENLAETDFVARTDELLRSADCSIHLIDPSAPVIVPIGWKHSVLENQILCAGRVENSSFKAWVWCDSGRTVNDAVVPLIARVRDDLSKTGPLHYIPQGFQYLTSNLPSMIISGIRDAPPLAMPSGKRVLIQCMKDDLGKLEPILEKLYALGIGPQVPLFDGPTLKRDAFLQRFLEETDGTLIYWGTGGDLWTYMLCDRAVEIYGSDLGKKKRFVGIDPPSETRRRFFSHPRFTTVPFPTDPGQLTLEQLRQMFL